MRFKYYNYITDFIELLFALSFHDFKPAMAIINNTINCTLVKVYPFTKYNGIEAMLVMIHQIQLSTFFFAIKIVFFTIAIKQANSITQTDCSKQWFRLFQALQKQYQSEFSQAPLYV